MNAKLALAFLALCVCIVPGSNYAFGQKLYPIQGPLAAQTPQLVFAGQIGRTRFGVVVVKSWTVAGEVLKGKSKTVMASSVNALPQAGTIPLPQPNLAIAWDTVYGEGFFVAHILGKKFGQGVFTGSDGTVLQVETLDRRNGVAVDNKGNMYKMVW